MCVEIRILSGTRLGEHLRLETADFDAGADTGCTVYFDPALNPAAAGTRVRFRRQLDGWFLERIAGQEVLVNHDVCPKRSKVRSGDVVRMSINGPDFQFVVLPDARVDRPKVVAI